ncbi:MAG: acylneuraminate cytidylyltransferase family protein [Flavobacteriaceae bacterium]
MKLTKEIFCFIPAKASSKRLKLKNIKPLQGKPMIQYAIEAAFQSKIFEDQIYVSTEKGEIAQIVENLGAKVPQLRPEKLANDPYGVKDVLLGFLSANPELKQFKSAAIILPTAPLIASQDICKAYALFNEKPNQNLISVTPTEHNALRSVYVRDNELVPLFEDCIRKKSQELEPTHRINGAIIIVPIKEFLKNEDFFTPPVTTYTMPLERSVDVDTESDFQWAEFLMQKKTHL